MELSVPETPSPPSAFSASFSHTQLPDSPFEHIDWHGILAGEALGGEIHR